MLKVIKFYFSFRENFFGIKVFSGLSFFFRCVEFVSFTFVDMRRIKINIFVGDGFLMRRRIESPCFIVV